jgi:hypothetical protein
MKIKNSIGLDNIGMKMQFVIELKQKEKMKIVIKLKARRNKSIYDRIESKKIVKQILFMNKTKICDKIGIGKEIKFMATLGLSKNQKQRENRSRSDLEMKLKLVTKP